jgi:hypothetical protein
MVVNEHLNLSCLGGSSNWRGFDVWRKSAQVPQQLGGSRRAVTAERHPPVGCRKFARPWWHLKPPGGTIKRGLRWISQDLWLLDVARVYILYIYMFINYIYIYICLFIWHSNSNSSKQNREKSGAEHMSISFYSKFPDMKVSPNDQREFPMWATS